MGTVVGAWRVRAMIVLFITIFTIYLCYNFFSDIKISGFSFNETEKYNITENDTAKGIEKSQNFFDIMLGLGGFLTFDKINNFWARLVINIFVTCCWIMIAYIGYTFIKEWIPFT